MKKTTTDLARIIAAHAPQGDEDDWERLEWGFDFPCEFEKAINALRWGPDGRKNMAAARAAIDAARQKDL